MTKTIPMRAKLYALLTDAYATDAPIYIFHEKADAVRAMAADSSKAAHVIPFFADGALGGATQGVVYLALTLEDSGMHIHAAYRNMFGLRSYLLDHTSETPCLTASAWLEPSLRNGHLVEEFHLAPQSHAA